MTSYNILMHGGYSAVCNDGSNHEKNIRYSNPGRSVRKPAPNPLCHIIPFLFLNITY